MKSLGDTDVNRDVWDAWRERPSLPGLWIRTLVGDWSKVCILFESTLSTCAQLFIAAFRVQRTLRLPFAIFSLIDDSVYC
jgi:hypothetical protein